MCKIKEGKTFSMNLFLLGNARFTKCHNSFQERDILVKGEQF